MVPSNDKKILPTPKKQNNSVTSTKAAKASSSTTQAKQLTCNDSKLDTTSLDSRQNNSAKTSAENDIRNKTISLLKEVDLSAFREILQKNSNSLEQTYDVCIKLEEQMKQALVEKPSKEIEDFLMRLQRWKAQKEERDLLANEIAKAKARLAEVTREVDVAKSEYQESVNRVSELDENIASNKRLLKNLRIEKQKVKDEINNLNEAAVRDSSELETQTMTEKNQTLEVLKQENVQMKKSKNDLQAEIVEAAAELKAVCVELDQLSKTDKKALKRLTKKQSVKKELEDENSKLTARVAQMRNDLKAQQKELVEIKSTSKKKNLQYKLVMRVKAKIMEMKQDLDEARTMYSALNAEIWEQEEVLLVTSDEHVGDNDAGSSNDPDTNDEVGYKRIRTFPDGRKLCENRSINMHLVIINGVSFVKLEDDVFVLLTRI
ncbi:hypothetical protein Bhyg_15596 [Pseudolycoriella hygida]|uniref:Uncharacterized protein n=1 Tax=Pseudolycoriella hygida TaxID=35572 RepID=A0A9Q0RVB0_9DIPT|nr:hypothetical protein Bhyg_15596 [Pseudolycoriella hygida]